MIVIKVPIRQYTQDELVSIRDVLIKKSGDKNVVIIPDDISVFLHDVAKEQLIRCREIIDCALAKYEEVERNEEHSDEHTTVIHDLCPCTGNIDECSLYNKPEVNNA